MKKAVQGLYKTADDSIRQAQFHGLEDGHTYGYLIKATYETSGSSYTMYTQVYYAAQDNTPPERVAAAQASLDGTDHGYLVWTPVTDPAQHGRASGVSSYLILRGLDSGDESVVDTVTSGGSTTWNDPDIIRGITFYYHVLPVDSAGNVGEGGRSNSLFLSGDDGGGNADTLSHNPVTTVADSVYFKGAVDTLWYKLEGWERTLQFQAVREDSAYFENPPETGARFFDSDTMAVDSAGIDPARPGYRYWVFNYGEDPNSGENIDLNFIDGRTYHRRVLRRDVQGTTFIRPLTSRSPDCFSPSDITQLAVHSYIADPDGTNEHYHDWLVRLNWEHALDGASGVWRYHIYRKISGIDQEYQEIAADTIIKDSWYIDTSIPGEGYDSNTLIYYKVGSEDACGNLRLPADIGREASDRALAKPHFTFSGVSHNVDTLFTARTTVTVEFYDLDVAQVDRYLIEVNGVESEYPANGSVTVTIPLDQVTFSRLRARTIFQSGRSGIWSDVKVVSLLNLPPADLQVSQKRAGFPGWTGDLYLQWRRASLDNKNYQVWRSLDSLSWQLVDDSVISSKDTVQWIDQYAFDEKLNQAGDKLSAYQKYFYKVRMISTRGDTSGFSPVASHFCPIPPEVTSDSLLSDWNGQRAIKITWERPMPSVAHGWWQTRISVSRDSLANVIYTTDEQTDVVDDTSFVFDQDVSYGHNYIFQLREITQYPEGRNSALSKPWTFNLVEIDSLFVIAQPHGRIYLNWSQDPLVHVLPIDYFRVERQNGSARDIATLPRQTMDYMDETGLVHGQVYTYTLFAMNYLDQVLASGSRTVTCDKGRAFIPEKAVPESPYFNSDSITVHWQFTDAGNEVVTGTTLGAYEMCLEMSATKTFPIDPTLTVSTGWFSARVNLLSRRVPVPPAVNENNEPVYIRLTARDRWMHPETPVWSDTTVSIFDFVRPVPVTSISVTSVTAYYAASDTILARLTWNDPSILNVEPLLANVARYEIHRIQNGQDILAGITSVIPGRTESAYTDTVRNGAYSWYIISRDSAGNIISSDSISFPAPVATPSQPQPLGYRSCQWDPVTAAQGTVQYVVEIASDPSHFAWAYQIGLDDPDNRLICHQDSLSTTFFTCQSGWGSVAHDTTWFRVKAKVSDILESGWSPLGFYTENNGSETGNGSLSNASSLPDEFTVYPNYPNPFNAETVISYDLPEESDMFVHIYNLQGKCIRSLYQGREEAGHHQKSWIGRDDSGSAVGSGIYFALIRAVGTDGSSHQARIKMVIVK